MGNPSEKELSLPKNVEMVIYEGMVNGMRGSNFNGVELKEKQNRVQAPFIELTNGRNLGNYFYKKIGNIFEKKIDLESKILYDKDLTSIIKNCVDNNIEIFSRELDTNGRFVNYQSGEKRIQSKDDFEKFLEYNNLIQDNILKNQNNKPKYNLPQLDLNFLNLSIFLSQISKGQNQAYFFGGDITNIYLPKSFSTIENLYDKIQNIDKKLPKNPELILLDIYKNIEKK